MVAQQSLLKSISGIVNSHSDFENSARAQTKEPYKRIKSLWKEVSKALKSKDRVSLLTYIYELGEHYSSIEQMCDNANGYDGNGHRDFDRSPFSEIYRKIKELDDAKIELLKPRSIRHNLSVFQDLSNSYDLGKTLVS